MLKISKSKKVYKTIIIDTKNKVSIDIQCPEDGHSWTLHSILVKKNKMYYTWERDDSPNTFVSSEEAFQKSLEMVKSSPDNFSNVEIREVASPSVTSD
jgi:hypothetical protein